MKPRGGWQHREDKSTPGEKVDHTRHKEPRRARIVALNAGQAKCRRGPSERRS
ncbi:BnaA02g12610D [Brassica napus]|uniref:BnaA02g12610D protein n=1 Tax=Brassica napus TaxID=3708 RepID=A0A078FKD3_BRANA|nr:BnaA02g12610D [Brassica napus]